MPDCFMFSCRSIRKCTKTLVSPWQYIQQEQQWTTQCTVRTSQQWQQKVLLRILCSQMCYTKRRPHNRFIHPVSGVSLTSRALACVYGCAKIVTGVFLDWITELYNTIHSRAKLRNRLWISLLMLSVNASHSIKQYKRRAFITRSLAFRNHPHLTASAANTHCP